MREYIQTKFIHLQQDICLQLERIDGGAFFSKDSWDRKEGGGGQTNTISNGKYLEKGGVAFSAVYGDVTVEMKKQLGVDGNSFFATGVSIVLHPNSPHIPIIHMNVRYFELDNGTYWFGGGIDLTPHFVIPHLAAEFHHDLKNVCDSFDPGFYAKFKVWADDYFYVSHRNETRGVGGIFFDHLSENNCRLSKDELVEFCLSLGNLFPSLYEKQILAGKNIEITEDQKEWQNLRRGRYVEFNLVHDRGTKFGLVSGGRTESILLSMPPTANWTYNYHPIENSEEDKTLNYLKKGIDWLSLMK